MKKSKLPRTYSYGYYAAIICIIFIISVFILALIFTDYFNETMDIIICISFILILYFVAIRYSIKNSYRYSINDDKLYLYKGNKIKYIVKFSAIVEDDSTVRSYNVKRSYVFIRFFDEKGKKIIIPIGRENKELVDCLKMHNILS